ncbi:MAG: hypothetical protein IPO66_23325 [Rhodanobacteraceae bacterium]|nr:hypothetical protein [Rhodanobacteraceae bacterium]
MDRDSAHSNPPPAPTRLDIGARSDVFLIRNFLTASECAAHIEASEARGYEEAAIAPETGTALVFMHDRTHEGELVTDGVKYVLRTDVMYRKG